MNENLERENKILKEYLDFAGVLILVLDREGKVIYINKSGCDILGYKKEEVIGKDWFENFLPQREREKIKNIFFSLNKGEVQAYSYIENPVLTKSGQEKMILWHNAVLRGEEGKITGTLSSGSDITSLKEQQCEIERSYRMTRTILEKAPFGVYMVNEEGGIDYVNPAMLSISGASYEEFRNLNVFELPTYKKAGISEKIKISLEKNQSFYLEAVEYISHFGKKFTVRNFTIVPVEEECKKKVLIFVEDVTGTKKLEKELRENVESLEGFKKSAVDREYRMMELKEEINRLSQQLGNAPPYDLDFKEEKDFINKNKRGDEKP